MRQFKVGEYLMDGNTSDVYKVVKKNEMRNYFLVFSPQKGFIIVDNPNQLFKGKEFTILRETFMEQFNRAERGKETIHLYIANHITPEELDMLCNDIYFTYLRSTH